LREKYLLLFYSILSVVSFALMLHNSLLEASILKIVSLIILGYLFLVKSNKWYLLFFTTLLFSGVKEVALIHGGENYPQVVAIFATLIYVFTLFLIYKSAKKIKVKLTLNHILSFIPICVVLIYFVITVLTIVFEKIDIPFILPVLCALFFLAMVIYMACIYYSEKNMRNLWLLLALMTHVFTFLITPIEALILPSIYLQAVINVVMVACHFFIYKFLTTPEYKVEFEEETFYL